MKPFNLEAAKRGDPIVYGPDSEHAEFLYHDEKTNTCLMRVPYTANPVLYKIQGCEFFFMAPKKYTVWVNLYHEGGWTGHETEKSANEFALGHQTYGGKAYPVEIEE